MGNQPEEKTSYGHEVQTDGCVYTVNCHFGEKFTLGQILASRVLRDLERGTEDKLEAEKQ